jgi:hypothetical protein
LEGVARSIDIGGTLQEYNFPQDPNQADAIALASDWGFVMRDIQKAEKVVNKKVKK